jgi:signal recognition particle GTPase
MPTAGMGDISGLLNLFSEKKLFDQPELMKKLQSGNATFTFRDMYDQFQNLLKMGPLSQVMNMLPNMGLNMTPGNCNHFTFKLHLLISTTWGYLILQFCSTFSDRFIMASI